MRQISRLSKIDFRLFRKFSWPSGLLDFSRFNLIYGWNASGKTTLSALFRRIEKHEPLAEGAAEFIVEGKSLDLTTLSADTPLPMVRVFNRDFINKNVLSEELAPIFYI